MRPPKHIRDRLKKKGLWFSTKTPPPEFSTFHEVQNLGSSPVPVPGAFSPVFNSFSAQDELPSIEVSVNDPFYEIAEVLDAVILENGLNREKLRTIGLTFETFVSRMLGVGCVSLAMHLAMTHKGMGFNPARMPYVVPELPPTMSSYIRNLGEFTGPDGRRWLLSDYLTHVRALVRCASKSFELNSFDMAAHKLWLPISTDDARTSHIVACRLQTWFRKKGIFPNFQAMRVSVFAGEIPPDIAALINHLPAADRYMVERLFQVYSTEKQFVEMFSDEIGMMALDALELQWINPHEDDLQFDFDAHSESSRVTTIWSSLSEAIQRLFWTKFALSVAGPCHGSKHQIAEFMGDGSTWDVSSMYYLSAEERTELVTLGSPMLHEFLPGRFQTHGTVHVNTELYTLLSEDFGM